MTKKHSDLLEWQEKLPNPPYRYVPHSATIVSNDGTTIASVGGDLKMDELAAAGELLAHCATRLPALIAAAEAFVMNVAGLSEGERDNLDCEIYNELHDQIAMAKAEPWHEIEELKAKLKAADSLKEALRHTQASAPKQLFTKADPRGSEYGAFEIIFNNDDIDVIKVRHTLDAYEMIFQSARDFMGWAASV